MVPLFLIFQTILRVVAGVEGKVTYIGTLKSKLVEVSVLINLYWLVLF